MAVFRVTGEYFEDDNIVTRARITSDTGAVFVDTDFTKWDLRVYDDDSSTPNTVVYSELAVPVATENPVLSALSTSGWTKDPTGYNFVQEVEQVNATGEVDLGGQPTAGDQYVISDGNTSVTFQFTSGSEITTLEERYVTIGASAAATTTNLISEINSSDFPEYTITAAAGSGGTNPVDLTNDVVGAAGTTTITAPVNVSGNLDITSSMAGGAGFPTKGGHTYRFEYRLVPATATDGLTWVVGEYKVVSTRSV